MKFKVSLSAMFLVLLGSGVLWAGDPWKEKPYTEWTEEDAQLVLHDSPWARTIKAKSPNTAVPGKSNCTHRPPTRERRVIYGPGGPPLVVYGPPTGGVYCDVTSSGTGAEQGPKQPRTRDLFTVVWFSSITAREAVARLGQLKGTLTAERVNQFLSQKIDKYILVVRGPYLLSLVPLSDEQLLKMTSLQPQRSKKPLYPVEVKRISSTPRYGKSLLNEIRFYFPREVNGEPLIGAKETKVIFFCRTKLAGVRAGIDQIKAKFDLKKMRKSGKRDL